MNDRANNVCLKKFSVLFFILELVVFSSADVYLHNPRGSNNRLDEKGRARNNANSLFDSQNNDRGGYNVGSLFYYQGSKLSIEWTNQHSCGDTNNHCEMVLQYMCDNRIRDGVTTQTIPNNRAQCENYNCNTDRRYRMHEDYEHYMACTLRERNKGLFTADQNMNKRNSARNTRQNPGGTRRGFECPEERDYYPYWHPSPWKDIAVLTNDPSRCHYYREESQNVKSKGACVFPDAMNEELKNKIILPNNKGACEKFELPTKFTGEPRKPTWVEYPSHGLPPPDCRETQYTRDNHLGNGIGGHPVTYNWTIPEDLEHETCALRIRYNISTSDYDVWNTNASMTGNPAKFDMAAKHGFDTQDEAKEHGYVFKNNPVVKIFEGVDNLELRLAINTAQFGRTFQDRSHTFAVRKRPAELKGQVIHNLNVRGKRGNIVQVYPGVEYDFVPNILEMTTNEYIHIQWTGSNTNPGNNDGQGLAGTDRNNIVLLNRQQYAEGSGSRMYVGGKHGHYGVNYPMRAENSTFLGLSSDDALTLAYVDPGQFRGEMSELDDAGTYFNLPPRKITKKGTYHYMCTRNNNFSNRDQKGRVIVNTIPSASMAIGTMGGNLTLQGGTARVVVEEGTFDALTTMRIEKWSTEEGEAAMKAVNRELNEGDDYASSFYKLSPDDLLSKESDKTFVFEMELDQDDDVEIFHADSDFSVWTRMHANIGDGVARVQAYQGGVYVARSTEDVGVIVGVVVALVVVLAIVGGTVFYCRRNPTKWQAVRSSCRNAGRSMQNKV